MTADDRIRILCIDDHPLVREGIAMIIGSKQDMHLVGQAATGSNGIEQYRQHKPDVTLMDVRLPDMSGIDALLEIRTTFINARIIMLSSFSADVEVRRALEAGASGFLLKTATPADLARAIRQVHLGKKCVAPEVAADLAGYLQDEALTAREVQVLGLLAQGKRTRDIADELSISEDTVKVHVGHIVGKLHVNDRIEAVVVGIRRGIIHL
jgi:DNA-binding NarL/FixJ family response regulator